MAERRERQSGLELLRIIAMLMIIAHHYSVHGGYDPLTVDNFSMGRLFVQLLGWGGRPACSIFALITGFFSINSAGGMRKFYKRLVPLIAQMSFYGLIFVLIAALSPQIPLSGAAVLSAIFPSAADGWYFRYYVALFLLIPFLNPMLKSLNRRQFAQLVAVLLTMWSVVPSISSMVGGALGVWSFGDMGFFLTMYILGAYIRLYVHGKTAYKNKWNLIIALALVALNFLLILLCDAMGVILNVDAFFWYGNRFCSENFVLCVGWAVCIFLFFANLNFSNRIVNRIAATTLGIYLIHDHTVARNGFLWKQIFPNTDYANAPYLHALLKISIVFVGCMLIDLLRAATVGKWFETWWAKSGDRVITSVQTCAQRILKRIRCEKEA